jgi:hypothetical protein
MPNPDKPEKWPQRQFFPRKTVQFDVEFIQATAKFHYEIDFSMIYCILMPIRIEFAYFPS